MDFPDAFSGCEFRRSFTARGRKLHHQRNEICLGVRVGNVGQGRNMAFEPGVEQQDPPSGSQFAHDIQLPLQLHHPVFMCALCQLCHKL